MHFSGLSPARNCLKHKNVPLTEIQYLQTEPSEKRAHANESMML